MSWICTTWGIGFVLMFYITYDPCLLFIGMCLIGMAVALGILAGP